MNTIGIDPGVNGGIAQITDLGQAVYSMPETRDDIRHLLFALMQKPCNVYLERQWARPSQGAGSMGRMMQAYGYLECILDIAGVAVHTPTPQSWKKIAWPDRVFPEGISASERTKIQKMDSLVRARELFPTLSGLDKMKDNGKAEALLIAYYGPQVS